MSATYTTAHGNARSLTHLGSPGIEPMSSWVLVGLITTEPRQELQTFTSRRTSSLALAENSENKRMARATVQLEVVLQGAGCLVSLVICL